MEVGGPAAGDGEAAGASPFTRSCPWRRTLITSNGVTKKLVQKAPIPALVIRWKGFRSSFICVTVFPSTKRQDKIIIGRMNQTVVVVGSRNAQLFPTLKMRNPTNFRIADNMIMIRRNNHHHSSGT